MKLTNEEKCIYCREYGNLPCDECKSNNRIKPVTMEKQLKATELRLGNYLFDRNNRLCQVKELGESIKAPAIKGARTSLPNKPIPLTEDILLRLGFENDKVEFTYENSRFVFKMMFYDCWNVYYKEKDKFGNDQINLCGFWYLHSLQNLFFILTGEELTFKN